MGLLDDAIREHLDLKRARGDDPAEIERMEREALGPVRREPTIGSMQLEARDERPRVAYEHGYEDDVTELEELQDLGYHDSTAPHARHLEDDPRQGHLEPHLEPEYPRFAEEQPAPEQPRRRFLRRNRDSAPSDRNLQDTGFREEEPPFESHELPPDDEAFGDHATLEHHELMADDDQAEHFGEAEDHDVAGQGDASSTPPHLRFDNPPKRPRFTAEPPSMRPADGDDEASAPAPVDEPDAHIEPQETTEFDVQRHIAETRHMPDEDAATRVHRAAPAEHPPAEEGEEADDDHTGDEAHADEDVLEETPEFLQDTPEHDRLWFEQRPPKDFDFDG